MRAQLLPPLSAGRLGRATPSAAPLGTWVSAAHPMGDGFRRQAGITPILFGFLDDALTVAS